MSVMEYFEHSYNLRNDFKVRVLRNKFGIEGYGIYLCLMEILTETRAIRTDEAVISTIAEDLGVHIEKLQSIVDFCTQEDLLSTTADKAIYSTKINNGYKEIIEKSKKCREAVNTRWSKSKFTPPTLEEVRAYCSERNNGIDAESFINFYESKGWKVGKNSMKNWKAAIRTWENRDKQGKPSHNGLGVGEYILDGKRTYGDGRVTIPTNAPARPSEQHLWDSMTQKWIIL